MAGCSARPALIMTGVTPVSSTIARVMVPGDARPSGLASLTSQLVMLPCTIISASRPGVESVDSGVAPAAETPGTVESLVFAITRPIMGRENAISDFSERKVILFYFE